MELLTVRCARVPQMCPSVPRARGRPRPPASVYRAPGKGVCPIGAPPAGHAGRTGVEGTSTEGLARSISIDRAPSSGGTSADGSRPC
jgi:hypothetical protein